MQGVPAYPTSSYSPQQKRAVIKIQSLARGVQAREAITSLKRTATQLATRLINRIQRTMHINDFIVENLIADVQNDLQRQSGSESGETYKEASFDLFDEIFHFRNSSTEAKKIARGVIFAAFMSEDQLLPTEDQCTIARTFFHKMFGSNPAVLKALVKRFDNIFKCPEARDILVQAIRERKFGKNPKVLRALERTSLGNLPTIKEDVNEDV